jgi:hypothetical protein
VDIHKPKPWHGFREFLKEYLIIVVGVLTALAGEQLVEYLHTQHQVAEARQALRDELRRNATDAAAAIEEDRCADAWMDRLAAWAKGGPKPDPRGATTRLATYPTTVWDIVKTGAVARMPLKEQLAFAHVYFHFENENVLAQHERDGAQKIVSYQDQAKLTPDQARSLLETIASTRAMVRAKLNNGPRLIADARALAAGPAPVAADERHRLDALCAAAGAAAPHWPAGS